MERKYVYASLIATSLWLTSCQQELQPYLPTLTPTISPPSEFTPVPINSPTPENTEVPTATLTVIEKFKLGSFDASNTPFTLIAPQKLQEALDFFFTSPRTFYADVPIPITLRYLDEVIAAPFAEAAKNHENNPYFVFLTDRPNHLFLYFHSLQYTSPGEFARILASYDLKNPDKTEGILGQTVDINTKDGQIIKASISDIRSVPTSFVDDIYTSDSPWGVWPDGDNVTFARLDRFGIPEEIINDETPGVYYITLITCVPEDGNIVIDPLHKAEAYAHNTAKRSLVTLKLIIGK